MYCTWAWPPKFHRPRWTISCTSQVPFGFSNLRDERLYHFHKLYAESYTTNTYNLEAPWNPVIDSILEGVVKVSDKLDRSIDMAVQQEQPLVSPALAAAAVDANNAMTSSKHKGTVYPDVFALQYLIEVLNNFRDLTCKDIGHNEIDYLVFYIMAWRKYGEPQIACRRPQKLL